MKNILLVYPPFCTPASPPYSITYLCSFLKNNCKENIEVLDLNLEFHKKAFPEYQKYYQKMEWKDYGKTTSEYIQLTKRLYSKNNKQVINKEHPGQFNELLNLIKEKKPDIVAFSIVYSSQAFYAYALIKELKVIGVESLAETLAYLEGKIKIKPFITDDLQTTHYNYNVDIGWVKGQDV